MRHGHPIGTLSLALALAFGARQVGTQQAQAQAQAQAQVHHMIHARAWVTAGIRVLTNAKEDDSKREKKTTTAR